MRATVPYGQIGASCAASAICRECDKMSYVCASQSDEEDGDLPGPGPPPPHEADGSGPPRLHLAGGGDRLNGFTLGRRRSTPSPERPASFPLVDYDDDDDDDADPAAAADDAAPAVPVSRAWAACHAIMNSLAESDDACEECML